jgi:uncharacterized protein
MNARSAALRASIDAHRDALLAILDRYHASNPRIFGSVARGDATDASDLDLIVELEPGAGNELLRVAGIGEEFRRELHVSVDVVTPTLLRDAVSATALADATAL